MEKTKQPQVPAAAAPTGCYKCGRPGHWSRDCPDANPKNTNNSIPSNPPSIAAAAASKKSLAINQKHKEKPKKVPRSRPKLTPDLFLRADNGLPFILRHLPPNFKCRGPHNLVSDLGNLIGLYREWHSRLLPYYSFEQFLHKVEQVSATKRVKICIRDLRERVASGGDPTRLLESETEYVCADVEHDLSTAAEALNPGGLHQKGDPFPENHNAEVIREDMLQEIYDRATEEGSLNPHMGSDLEKQKNGTSYSGEVQITAEQRARMEANKLKALKRVAARARPLHST